MSLTSVLTLVRLLSEEIPDKKAVSSGQARDFVLYRFVTIFVTCVITKPRHIKSYFIFRFGFLKCKIQPVKYIVIYENQMVKKSLIRV